MNKRPEVAGRRFRRTRPLIAAITAIWALGGPVSAAEPRAGPPPIEIAAERLKAAYPGIVTAIEHGSAVFADGTRLPFDDRLAPKDYAVWLETPDIKDMFRQPYLTDAQLPPPPDWDPGRARNEAFFLKVYGDCRRGAVEGKLADVVWLPKKWGHKLKFTKVNGAAAQLRKVSGDLDQLAKKYDIDLFPTAGTYNCRKVAGTEHRSPHGYGIAIDIALKHSSYWRWFLTKPAVKVKYRNAIPMEIVRVFERHGFIWGGRWHHFDTMHFEYRPEMLMSAP